MSPTTAQPQPGYPHLPTLPYGGLVTPGTPQTYSAPLPPPYQLPPQSQGSLLPGAGSGGVPGQTATYFGVSQPVVNPQCCPCPA
jgi:hypothetical protein